MSSRELYHSYSSFESMPTDIAETIEENILLNTFILELLWKGYHFHYSSSNVKQMLVFGKHLCEMWQWEKQNGNKASTD